MVLRSSAIAVIVLTSCIILLFLLRYEILHPELPCQECGHCGGHSESRVFDHSVPEFVLSSSYFLYQHCHFLFHYPSLVVYTAPYYLGLPSTLQYYAATIGLLLDIPTCEGAVKQYFSIQVCQLSRRLCQNSPKRWRSVAAGVRFLQVKGLITISRDISGC